MCKNIVPYLSTPAGIPPATTDTMCREKRTAESREAAKKNGQKTGYIKGNF